jgi:hypothetical protein
LAVDGRTRDCHRQAGADRCLAGDVEARRPLLHGAAHDHVLDLAGLDAGAFDGRLDGVARERGPWVSLRAPR